MCFRFVLILTTLFSITALNFARLSAKEKKESAAKGLPPAATGKIDFVRDVAPILESKCFHCHGPEEQEGLLRLDAPKLVFVGGQSGPLLKKGDSAASLLIHRLVESEDQERMPLEDEPLTNAEIGLVRAWIDQGAIWPKGFGSQDDSISKHWAYVAPQRAALPEVKNKQWSKNSIDAFVLASLEKAGLTPSAEAQRVKLLRRVYLDLIGLPPTINQVDAFLADKSARAYGTVVDQLLASPRYGERWAQHWLDLARYADSNGYQADQFRDMWPYRDWVIQAFNSGMPYDRFTIEQLAGDLLPDATLNQKIASGFHRSTTCNVEAGVDPEENRTNQIIDRVNVTSTVWLGTTIDCTQCHNHKYDPFTQKDFYGLFAFFNNTPLEVKLASGVQYNFYGPTLSLPLPKEKAAQREDLRKRRDVLKGSLQEQIDEVACEEYSWGEALKESDDDLKEVPKNITKVLAIASDERTKKQEQALSNYYFDQIPEIKKSKAQLATLDKQFAATKPDTTLTMVEMDKPRMTNIFKRGNFLDKGKQVEPGTPRILHPYPDDAPANRLGLARWLVDPQNPLIARVAVNRWWAEIFGAGIVVTLEDFGTQGDLPTHPELLDWLAVEFVQSGWSMKHMHKLIVLSSTYRQSSRMTPKMLKEDPYNRRLARGPRFRLSAEAIRDNALAISGLLSSKMGGPPIFPPQPSGVWRHVGRNAPKFITSTGEDRFRRGVYVVWRRSAPYASFVNFDAPDRAATCVKRPRTNTPLQALTLLNDPAYVEMAKVLARRMMVDCPNKEVQERAAYGFRLCVAREPNERERNLLNGVFLRERARLKMNPAAVRALTQGIANVEMIDKVELAAWFYVANILLNLDETVTKG